MRFCFVFLVLGLLLAGCQEPVVEKIDRYALVKRNNPVITEVEELSALSVGNGNFAVTVDATGLQTFPEHYSKGMPLGTQSQWGWHSFPNPENYSFDETLKEYDFRGKPELYSVQFKDPGRQKAAADWYRVNPHRLHLGYIGFELGDEAAPSSIENLQQELDMWNGQVKSQFNFAGEAVQVETAIHPEQDVLAVKAVTSLFESGKAGINIRFAYPTGKHADDATDWGLPEKHQTEIVRQDAQSCLLKRTLDSTVYYVELNWEGEAKVIEKASHYFVLQPGQEQFAFSCSFYELPSEEDVPSVTASLDAASAYWQNFWQTGGAVDFSKCTAGEARELERRVVLSQYLMAIQCAGDLPPQETGLTYNSWYGKFHLEMHWWHAVHFALWNRPELLERSMGWYAEAYPMAKAIAERQGFDGIRWMKMTDPSATEAPSNVGSFLIWQQPHFIYMAELLYRHNPSQEILDKYGLLVEETAAFMASFADYDMMEGRYILQGVIPAQETLRAIETINPPFELSYWHFGLSVAQEWRERAGKDRRVQWDEIIDKLSPLTALDGMYLASEDAVDTYKDIRFTSDHPAVLGALGMLPQNKLMRADYMQNTLNWIWDNWNWGKTWGWDFPMTAMSAARLGDPEKAVGALLMDKRTNTYLVNGHNYQDARLRVYLPGNGGLLTAVAMMCAGWDGNELSNPGFPTDGTWDVVWEDLKTMP
jgi:hypothetical protein